ncbi:MAG: hypothetical protein ACJKTH_00420 [Patescibacteria group bacterium UBA2163]
MKKLFKNWMFWFFLLSVAGAIAGYFFNHSYQFGICYINYETRVMDTSCPFPLLGDQLFYPSIALAIVFFLLFFIPQAVHAWRKFAVWYIPIAIILIWWPDESSSGGWDLGPSNSEFALILSSLYVGVSLGVIGVSILSERRQRSGKKKLHVLWYWLSGVVLGIGAMLIASPYIRLLVEWIMAGARL